MTREEAIKTVDRIFNYCEEIDCHLPEEEQTGYDMYPDIRAVIEYIRNIPEVVRCKDCKYRIKEWRGDKRLKDKGYWVYGCEHFAELMGYWGWGGNDNEYCSHGERKETDEMD